MANKQSVAALRSRLYKWSGEGFQECSVGQRTGRARQAAPVVVGRDQAGRITGPVLVGAEVRLAACLDLGEQVAEVGAGQAGDEAGEAQRDGLPRLPECFVGDVQGRDRHGRCSAGGVGYRSTQGFVQKVPVRAARVDLAAIEQLRPWRGVGTERALRDEAVEWNG
jgi:hypothetical protein